MNVGIFSLGGHLGANYNFDSGLSINYGIRGGLMGVGLGVGGANYWDTNWNFRGGTWYVEGYAGALIEGFGGYEHGYGGTMGRGFYVGFRGLGFDLEMTENFGELFSVKGTMTLYEHDFGKHASGITKDKLKKTLEEYNAIKSDTDVEAPYNQEVYVTDMNEPMAADRGNDPRDFDMDFNEFLAHTHNTIAGHYDHPSNSDINYASNFQNQHPMSIPPAFLIVYPEMTSDGYSKGKIQQYDGSGVNHTWKMENYGKGSWGLKWRHRGRNH